MNVGRVRLTAAPRTIGLTIDHERPGDEALLTFREAAVLRDELTRLLERSVSDLPNDGDIFG